MNSRPIEVWLRRSGSLAAQRFAPAAERGSGWQNISHCVVAPRQKKWSLNSCNDQKSVKEGILQEMLFDNNF
eukprot:scaffold1945_cov181-Ochromonas_danica.AAC.2